MLTQQAASPIALDRPLPVPHGYTMNHETKPSADESVGPLIPTHDEPGRATVGKAGEQIVGEDATSSEASPWRELPVRDGPDRHQESHRCSFRAPGGFCIVGSSVRGKKHKHEGANRDDWFEVALCGAWTIIAASDGAGSRAFSRVGARVSCDKAVSFLSERLADHMISPRDAWTAGTFARGASHAFLEPDLAFVQTALVDSIETAREAVASAASLRETSREHEAILGRSINGDDLSATLILAVHTIVTHRDVEYSLILACQIGDGISAALFSNDALQLLGTSDGGKYSGETAFLASANNLGRAELFRRTHIGLGPLRALMVMTDGVADDYFPNDPELRRLYDDLLSHRIVNSSASGGRKALSAILNASEPPLGDPDPVGSDELSKEAPQPATPISDHPLVGPGADPTRDSIDSDDGMSPPEERLRSWLDSYHVRGSFDDRTLIVVYREI
jgi:Protein phosphatase 2C